MRCCVPLADCGCAPPVFIRHRYDACAYFLQSFEFWHSFKRFLLPFFVCCMFGFFTTLRPSLTWFERIRQLIYTNLVQFCYFNIKTLSCVWACLACMCVCAWLLAPVCVCVLAWPLCVRLLAPCMCMFFWSESFAVLQSEAVKIVFNYWLYCLSVTQSRSCAVCLFTFLLLAGRTLSCFFFFFCRSLLS